ncbi:hypothetical protein BJ875DRAFT_473447 [Amylocarpus encephaloides]|uniref:O-methyltransferase domain-containing protein n=1 Tax=Amylocarpus encephaloides TaxID=45428 RepID=A0A9P7YB62_9HELO|nr:hypothetical protein BJ875DRAFT_473447 [Amylocarpus encephaloides]
MATDHLANWSPFAAMDSVAKLERYGNELALAVQSLAAYSRSTGEGAGADADAGADAETDTLPTATAHPPFIGPDAGPEVLQAKQSVLLNVARIKALVYAPSDFLKHLASQGGILGCLRWLGEFQILACIPLTGSVPITDVADLTGVSETQLSRIVRLVASAGFLQFPVGPVGPGRVQEAGRPAHVAHTALSAPFVTNPSLLDATMFLAECATSAVLQTQSHTHTLMQTRRNQVAHQSPKLRRQQSAYLTYAGGLDAEDAVVDNLMQLNWANIGNVATPAGVHVVEVGAQSTMTARSLTALNPVLRFQMQLDAGRDRDLHRERQRQEAFERELDPAEPRITITHRPIGVGCPQATTDAAVYILHLPEASSAILAELNEHLGVLRAGNAVMLILTSRLLPEPGSLPDPETEAAARARDLAWLHLQLTTAGEMEMVELLDMIETVGDHSGKLVVINKLRSRDNVVIALAVKYVDHGLGLWSGTGTGNGHGVGIGNGFGDLVTENSQ